MTGHDLGLSSTEAPGPKAYESRDSIPAHVYHKGNTQDRILWCERVVMSIRLSSEIPLSSPAGQPGVLTGKAQKSAEAAFELYRIEDLRVLLLAAFVSPIATSRSTTPVL